MILSDVLGCMRLKLGWWQGGAWANFVFLIIFWRAVMIGVRFTSFLVLLDVLARTRLKLGGWVELGPNRIYELYFWRVLMVGVPGRVSLLGRRESIFVFKR